MRLCKVLGAFGVHLEGERVVRFGEIRNSEYSFVVYKLKLHLKHWYMDTQTVPHQLEVLLVGVARGSGGNCLVVFPK